MSDGLLDAWLVHLAEGVRDCDRRAGDPHSSRAEFAELKAKGSFDGCHGGRSWRRPRAGRFRRDGTRASGGGDGAGDGHGAKLVWSPLSNLLLYGQTAAVYDAIAAGVLVSLGTDWTPSGSPNLLTELKVADRALRDVRLLGGRRAIVPEFMAGQGNADAGAAERALDRLLVEMVTINPAITVRWDDQVGSIEDGKAADLLVIDAGPAPTDARRNPGLAVPAIDRCDRTRRCAVMVGGIAQAGDLAVMSSLKPGDFEVISSQAGCFDKGIDLTNPSIPHGSDTLADISARLADGLTALGGDHPPAGGGPSSPFANTWSYLKAHIPGASELPDLMFNLGLAFYFGTPSDGRVNLESMTLPPLFTVDDHWWFATLAANRDALDLTVDSAPPYAPYPANLNQDTPAGNPFAAPLFHDRWYGAPCAAR